MHNLARRIGAFFFEYASSHPAQAQPKHIVDNRQRLPHEVVDSLGKIISQLGSAANLEELLSMKQEFIESLGKYSMNRYSDVGTVWQHFRREYQRAEYIIKNRPIDNYVEIEAQPWNHRGQNY